MLAMKTRRKDSGDIMDFCQGSFCKSDFAKSKKVIDEIIVQGKYP